MTWPEIMDEPTYSADFLREQHGAWLRLATALEQAQSALLAGDLAGFEAWTTEQQQTCKQLLPARKLAEALSRPSRETVAMLENIESLRQKVYRLNQVHAALLRRASHSLTILRNLIEHNRVAYAPPRSLRSPVTMGERGGI